jgi:two-component system, NarL family, response regulator LiaR
MPSASTDTDALRVLVVDDSAPLRERICLALAQAGLTIVGEASDGAHALAQAAAQRPDVILMDVSMPGMDGIQATRALRRRHPETRVVLWSGDSDDQLADAVWHSGAHAGLAKGTRTTELIATLQRVCGIPQHVSWDAATAT